MIGKRFAQVIAQVPQHAEAIGRMPHQLPFGANAFKKHHELQLEKDHRINGGTTSSRIGLLHELAHEREVE
jgi:hypothetical protein